MSLEKYNFTWGEQPSDIDLSYSNEYPLPDWWKLDSVAQHYTSESCEHYTSESCEHYMIVSNCLSLNECNQFMRAIEYFKGYEQHNTVTELGKKVIESSKYPIIWTEPSQVRTNGRRLWQVPRTITDTFMERLNGFIPKTVERDGTQYLRTSINRRFRFFETQVGQEFFGHIDAGSSRLNEMGDTEYSFYTLVIWLNDNYTGGHLLFITDNDNIEVDPQAGAAILFAQAAHPKPIRHQGLPIQKGTKYILRTDIFYK